eukprot:3134918-Heterocapsa_arctica.AAC.1
MEYQVCMRCPRFLALQDSRGKYHRHCCSRCEYKDHSRRCNFYQATVKRYAEEVAEEERIKKEVDATLLKEARKEAEKMELEKFNKERDRRLRLCEGYAGPKDANVLPPANVIMECESIARVQASER